MYLDRIKLMDNSDAILTVYLHEVSAEIDQKERPMILVIPGGGYEMVSDREGEPIAMAYYERGYHAAVLSYSVGNKARHMQAQIEGVEAMKWIRENSKNYHIMKDHVAVAGFSAGGHLACSMGTMWNEPKLMERWGYTDDRYKPDAMILSYPVITAGEFAHRGSFYQLTGSNEIDEANRFFSLENRVDKSTPPTFIWHTQDDGCVPVENTLFFVMELQKAKVPYECHIFDHGGHGLALCNEQTNTIDHHCEHWLMLSVEWLKRLWK